MRWRKNGEMAFLTSRNANKHILLVLGVNRTARGCHEGEITGVSSILCLA